MRGRDRGRRALDELELLVDLHLDGRRQGPGSDAATRQAISLAGLEPDPSLRIVDIGCGTGAASLLLARALEAPVVAVDLLAPFLAKLAQHARAAGLARRIAPVAASMEALPFADAAFDVVWSEGAVYNMGFAQGVASWRRLLQPGGILAVSELTWLTAERPAELRAYWDEAYPEVDTASAKLGVLERHGYTPIGYFALPPSCWLDTYYRPLQQRFSAFLERHRGEEVAEQIVASEKAEIDLYERHQAQVSYGFYIARRLAD